MTDATGLRKRILDVLCGRLHEEAESLEATVSEAREAATHGELRQEGKYDTRGIEAGYLAGAHARRLQELRENLIRLEGFRSAGSVPKDRVAAGSIVTLEGDAGTETCFVAPVQGGGTLTVDGVRVKVITATSPMGEAMSGLRPGETFEIEVRGEDLEYRVVSTA